MSIDKNIVGIIIFLIFACCSIFSYRQAVDNHHNITKKSNEPESGTFVARKDLWFFACIVTAVIALLGLSLVFLK